MCIQLGELHQNGDLSTEHVKVSKQLLYSETCVKQTTLGHLPVSAKYWMSDLEVLKYCVVIVNYQPFGDTV